MPEPVGSGPGLLRLVVVIQCDDFIRSAIRTLVCVPMTGNLRWATAPGNVLIPREGTGLAMDSVANVSQIIALDREVLTERIGEVSEEQLDLIFAGIDVVLGR